MVAVIAFALTGCGIPISVARVKEPRTNVKGVRYQIKRPAYDVALRINPDAAQHREVIVSQVLKNAATYEATTHPNPFADTDISIVTEDDGALSSVSAGETDKSLETITSAIALAATVATFALDPAGKASLKTRCGSHVVEAFAELDALEAEYAAEEKLAQALHARVLALTAELKSLLDQPKPDAKRISGLRRDRNRILKDVAAAKVTLDALGERTIPLDDEDYLVTIESGIVENGQIEPPAAFGSGTCVHLTLTPKRDL